jgi:ferric-chelate reductase
VDNTELDSFRQRRAQSFEVTSILAIAGGMGVSLTLPVVLAATSSPVFEGAAIDFIWKIAAPQILNGYPPSSKSCSVVQARSNTSTSNIHVYVTQEYDTNASTTGRKKPEEKAINVGIDPLPEADSLPSSSEKQSGSGNFKLTDLESRHPSLQDVVSDFVETRASFDYRILHLECSDYLYLGQTSKENHVLY